MSDIILTSMTYTCGSCKLEQTIFVAYKLFQPSSVTCVGCKAKNRFMFYPAIEDYPMTIMKQYQCHKIVHAQPMTAEDFYTMSQKPMPDNVKPSDEGYHVVYSKSEPEEYHSWSPKKTFDEGYQELKDDSLHQ